jgi:hypothetical protein
MLLVVLRVLLLALLLHVWRRRVMLDILSLSNQPTNIIDEVCRHLQKSVRLSPLTAYPDLSLSGQFLSLDKLNLQFMCKVRLILLLLCGGSHLTIAGWLGVIAGGVVGFDLCEIDLEVVELIGDTVLFTFTLWSSAGLINYRIASKQHTNDND